MRDLFWLLISVGIPTIAGFAAVELRRRQGYHEWYCQKFGVQVGAIASIIVSVGCRLL